jgi:hypothetical protein
MFSSSLPPEQQLVWARFLLGMAQAWFHGIGAAPPATVTPEAAAQSDRVHDQPAVHLHSGLSAEAAALQHPDRNVLDHASVQAARSGAIPEQVLAGLPSHHVLAELLQAMARESPGFSGRVAEAIHWREAESDATVSAAFGASLLFFLFIV